MDTKPDDASETSSASFKECEDSMQMMIDGLCFGLWNFRNGDQSISIFSQQTSTQKNGSPKAGMTYAEQMTDGTFWPELESKKYDPEGMESARTLQNMPQSKPKR